MFGMNEDDSDVSEVDLNDDDFEEFDTSFATSSVLLPPAFFFHFPLRKLIHPQSDIDQSLSTLLDKQFDNDGAAFEKVSLFFLHSLPPLFSNSLYSLLSAK